jgi:hypothetical protein
VLNQLISSRWLEGVAPSSVEKLSSIAHLLVLQLTAAALVWRPRNVEGRRFLVVERGRVARAGDLARGAPVSPPAGWERSRLQRMRAFDAATYDRLRVLTTEVRRVVGETDDVALHLGPARCLHRAALARRLRWF